DDEGGGGGRGGGGGEGGRARGGSGGGEDELPRLDVPAGQGAGDRDRRQPLGQRHDQPFEPPLGDPRLDPAVHLELGARQGRPGHRGGLETQGEGGALGQDRPAGKGEAERRAGRPHHLPSPLRQPAG